MLCLSLTASSTAESCIHSAVQMTLAHSGCVLERSLSCKCEQAVITWNPRKHGPMHEAELSSGKDTSLANGLADLSSTL